MSTSDTRRKLNYSDTLHSSVHLRFAASERTLARTAIVEHHLSVGRPQFAQPARDRDPTKSAREKAQQKVDLTTEAQLFGLLRSRSDLSRDLPVRCRPNRSKADAKKSTRWTRRVSTKRRTGAMPSVQPRLPHSISLPDRRCHMIDKPAERHPNPRQPRGKD